MPEQKVNPFQALEVKLSAGTPIEAIMEAAAAILKPITDAINVKRQTMSQENRDRYDLLEYAIHENVCLRFGLVQPERLQELRLLQMPKLTATTPVEGA